MKFKIFTTEVEMWEKEYLVDAEDKEEAEKKYRIGEWEECLESNNVDTMIKVDVIEDVNEKWKSNNI